MPYGDGQFTGVEAEQQLGRTGIRVATEFITGLKQQGTDADPWPGSAIQAAIDDLPVAGGVVFVSSGTWEGGTITVPSDVTLDIRGKIRLADSTDANLIENSDQIGGNTNITIMGDGVLDGNKANNGATSHGIHLKQCTNSRITGITVQDFNDIGIRVDGASDYDARCLVRRCSVSGSGSFGISVVFASITSVIGNLSTGNGSHGIHIAADDVTVMGNLCQSNTGSGILTGSFVGVALIGNVCKSNTSDGIRVAQGETSVIGNLCWANLSGIRVTQNKHTVVGNNCNGNNRHGIWINGASFCTVEGNIVTDNSEETDNTYDGIFLDGDSNENSIIGNTCNTLQPTFDQRYGINISEAACDDNLVALNILNGNVSGELNDVGTNTILEHNRGYVTENKGTATIANGTSSIAVPHGLVAAPAIVAPGPKHAEVSAVIWSADGTNITFTVPSNVTADRDVSWYAEV